METRANNLLVGTFVLLILAGTTVFFLWLARFQFDVEYTRYDIRFPGSVSGLKVGSSVELNGVLVGEVIYIQIDPEEVETVIVTIEVPATTPVRETHWRSSRSKALPAVSRSSSPAAPRKLRRWRPSQAKRGQ